MSIIAWEAMLLSWAFIFCLAMALGPVGVPLGIALYAFLHLHYVGDRTLD